MKVALWIGSIVGALATAYIGLLLLIPGDVITSNYPTLKEARADRLFERGWLPDILPASARDIRTTNNADINTSAGEFRFAAADYPVFASRLRSFSTLYAPPPDLDRYVQRMRKRGYQSGVFSDDTSIWLFVCEATGGYCEYSMWIESE